MKAGEIDKLAAIVRATPILPSATVDFEYEGRSHLIGVRGPDENYVAMRLEAIMAGLVRAGVPFTVNPRAERRNVARRA